jgi:Asp-tRNAAsn/Glu-tRNAGln amidotransferase A subunit and related amidases
MNSMPPIADLDLRRASLCQLLHWLAVGRVQPQTLADAYQQAIERLNPELNAYVDERSGLLQDQAHMADRRRRDGVIGGSTASRSR